MRGMQPLVESMHAAAGVGNSCVCTSACLYMFQMTLLTWLCGVSSVSCRVYLRGSCCPAMQSSVASGLLSRRPHGTCAAAWRPVRLPGVRSYSVCIIVVALVRAAGLGTYNSVDMPLSTAHRTCAWCATDARRAALLQGMRDAVTCSFLSSC